MSTRPPAWIVAWERGFAAGTAARESGRTLREVIEDRASDDSDFSPMYFIGARSGFDGEAEAVEWPPPLWLEIVGTVLGSVVVAWVGKSWRRGALVAPSAFLTPRLRPAIVRRLRGRPATRAEVAPGVLRPADTALVLVSGWTFQWDAKRRGAWPASAATLSGRSIGLILARQRARRRDEAAWRAWTTSRPTRHAGSG